ncbi:MAG: SDR family oxidoreductase, partial [Opitutales bacterium]|nr:SDR family oxidoreductase [Opitutales bacterium]
IPMLFINQLSTEQWREVMNNDANGFFNIVHASLPHLRQQGGSYVVISTTGLKRWPTRDVLSVAPKAAIDALVTGIAREEGKFGIRANTVALGLIDAGLFQRLRGTEYSEEYVEAAIRNSSLKRLGTADEVADSVVFFASDRARFVTGQTLVLDGGFSL